MKSNRYLWQSFSPGSALGKRCRENITKFTEKRLHQDLYFDNAGESRLVRIPGGVQLVLLRYFSCMESYFYCMESSMESMLNVFSLSVSGVS